MARAGAAALLAVTGWWTSGLATGRTTWCFMDFVNLAFHEAGHVFATPFGSTVHYLGGTLGQLFVPALLVGYFLIRRPSPIAAAFCSWWIGESLINVSIYMADARELTLPLVGGGDHDWNELFFRFGVLDHDSVEAISSTVHGLGVVVMLAGLAWIGLFVLPRWRRNRVVDNLAEKLPFVAALRDRSA